MLGERITSAIIFRKGVYAEAAGDGSFNGAAWRVAAVAFGLNALGGQAHLFALGGGRWLAGALLAAGLSLLAFALTARALPWLARSMYGAEVTFEGVLRGLGLASLWSAVGLLGLAAGLAPFMACLTGPAHLLALGAMALAYWIALQELSGLRWGQSAALALFALLAAGLAGLTANLLASLVWGGA